MGERDKLTLKLIELNDSLLYMIMNGQVTLQSQGNSIRNSKL